LLPGEIGGKAAFLRPGLLQLLVRAFLGPATVEGAFFLFAVTFEDAGLGQSRGPRFRGQRADIRLFGILRARRRLTPSIPRFEEGGLFAVAWILGRKRLATPTISASAAATPASAAAPTFPGFRGFVLGRGRRHGLRRWLLRLGRGLRIAQKSEHPRFDPYEGRAGGFLHRAGKLGLHGDLRGSPHEGQELALHGFFGQLLVVEGLPLALQDLQRRFEECHRGCFFTTIRAGVGRLSAVAWISCVFLTLARRRGTRDA
jgi:hypothetical protein